MARTCTVCSHPERTDIELGLVSGQSQRALSASFRVSHDAIRRHADAHLSGGLRKAAEGLEAARADNLVAEMAAVAQEAREAFRRAKEAGEDRMALAALREVRESIKALAAIAPEPDEAERVALIGALARVLPRHPDCARELAAALDELGAGDLASAVLTAV